MMVKQRSNLVRVFLVPTGVMMAAFIGGAYGTGREAVQFISISGPLGGVFSVGLYSVLTGIIIAFSFMLSQMYKAYDYRNFIKILIGPGWILYEIVIIAALLLVLSVCSSASGEILHDYFGLPLAIGSLLTISLIVLSVYWGRTVVEWSMVFCSFALIIMLAIFIFLVLFKNAGVIFQTISSSELKSDWWVTASQYAWLTVGFIPVLLYCASGFHTKGEAIRGGMFAGIMVALPAGVFHISYMVHYPEVLSEPIPILWVMKTYRIPFFLYAYVIVLFSLIVQTGVACIQGVIERLDAWRCEVSGNPLSKKSHALITLAIGIFSLMLAKVGIISLVAKGYGIIAWCWLVLFVIPLLTVGLYKFFSSTAKIKQ